MMDLRIVTVNGEKFVGCSVRPYIHKIQEAYMAHFATSVNMTGERPGVVEWFKQELGVDYDAITQELIFKNERDLTWFALHWA